MPGTCRSELSTMKTVTAARVGVKVRSEGEENLIFFAIANLFFYVVGGEGS